MALVQLNQDYTAHITQILQPSSNKGGLYLGNQVAASNLALLQKYKISSIITVAIQLQNKYPSTIRHKQINITDDAFTNIYQHFEPNYQYIKKCLQEGNVFIHCKMGISRSSSLVIAYLMRKYKCGYEKVLQKVKDRRSVVNPNPGFVLQLKQYDVKIKEMVKKSKK